MESKAFVMIFLFFLFSKGKGIGGFARLRTQRQHFYIWENEHFPTIAFCGGKVGGEGLHSQD